MDKIKIDNLKIFAHHGVFDFEQEQGQNFYVNAVFFLPLQRSGLTDDLEQSVSYAEIATFTKEFLTENTYQLIETAAEQLTIALFEKFPKIQKIQMEICKPEAPLEEEFESVSVEIIRERHKVYVAFGSNMGESENTIQAAIDTIKQDKCCKVGKISKVLKSTPYGGVEQNDFYNGVLELETLYEPYELLDFLHKIENLFGRTREIHWGPRTLDLDIIMYDNLILDQEDLIIPHPDMCNRDFVLIPLAEIADFARHPVRNLTIKEILQQFNEKLHNSEKEKHVIE